MSGPRPHELPELRAHLLREWEPGGLLWTVAVQRATLTQPPSVPHHAGRWDAQKNIVWEQRTLTRSSLWFVAAEMVDVLVAASHSIPDGVLPTDMEPLAPNGLVVLEKPWIGTSVDKPGLLQIDAFAWGPVTLPPLRPDDDPNEGVAGVSIALYSLMSEEIAGPRANRFNGRVWGWLGRSDWPLRDAIESAPWEMDDQHRESFVEDRRVLVALTTLLAHGGIADTIIEHAPRSVTRRLARDPQLGNVDSTYRVVTLRRLREPADWRARAGDEPVAHDHRWMVGAATGGFWRRQAYGPNHSLRRLQWIMPYVAGPEDMPLRVPETVHAWRR